MAEIAKLRKHRDTVKAKIIRLETKVSEAENRVNREQTEVFLSRLKTIRSEFETIQREITALKEETEANDADSTEDKYFELKIKLKQWPNRLMPVRKVEAHSSTNDETLSHVLQQQSELMAQLSQQNGSSQAQNGSNYAIARVLEQQTQLLCNLAEVGNTTNLESSYRW